MNSTITGVMEILLDLEPLYIKVQMAAMIQSLNIQKIYFFKVGDLKRLLEYSENFINF